MDETLGRWINDVCTKARNTAENVIQVISDNATRRTLLGRSLESIKSARQLEGLLLESSKHKFLIPECLIQWSNNLVDVNDYLLYNYDYDDNELKLKNMTLNFRQVFLRSSALESLVRTMIISNVNHKTSSNKDDDILIPTGKDETDEKNNTEAMILKKCLKQIFTLCLSGSRNIHDEIINLVLNMKPMDDTHPELVVQLINTLKINWKDDLLLEQRKRIATEVLSLDMQNTTVSEGASTNLLDRLLLHKDSLDNISLSSKCNESSYNDYKGNMNLLRSMLSKCKLECRNSITNIENADADIKSVYMKDSEPLNNLILQCDGKISEIRDALVDLEERKKLLLEELDKIQMEIDMKLDMLNIKENELLNAKKEINTINESYIKTISNDNIKDDYLRKYNDIGKIKSLTDDSDEFMKRLYNSTGIELENKYTTILNNIKSIIQQYSNYIIEKLDSDINIARSIINDIQTNKKTQNIIEDLNSTYINIEQTWSDFMDFHSDNSTYISHDQYNIIKNKYNDAKQLISPYL